MTAGQSLSIVVPAYNEAGNILGTLQNIASAMSKLTLLHEILVIDDGSSDGTGNLVTAHARRFPGVRLITNDRNRGFGWTYRRGVEAAALDHIVMVHGDNAWGADTLQEFFRHVGEADIVIGYTRSMWRSRSWTRTADLEDLHAVRQPDYRTPARVLQRPANSSGGRSEEPARSSRAVTAFRPRCSPRVCRRRTRSSRCRWISSNDGRARAKRSVSKTPSMSLERSPCCADSNGVSGPNDCRHACTHSNRRAAIWSDCRSAAHRCLAATLSAPGSTLA